MLAQLTAYITDARHYAKNVIRLTTVQRYCLFKVLCPSLTTSFSLSICIKHEGRDNFSLVNFFKQTYLFIQMIHGFFSAGFGTELQSLAQFSMGQIEFLKACVSEKRT